MFNFAKSQVASDLAYTNEGGVFFFFYNAGTPVSGDAQTHIIKILEVMRDRVPWYLARKIFKKFELPIGHGWSHTAEALNSVDTSKVDVRGLLNAYLDHICFGEKSVKFYKFADADIMQLRKSLENFPNPSFLPLPLSGSDLKKAPVSDPTLVYVRKERDGLTAIYSSVRSKDEQVRLQTSSLPDPARKAIGDFEEIIGIQSKRLQSYDVAWIPAHGNSVEIRNDHLAGETKETVSNAHQKIYADLHSRSGSHALVSPVDLFSAIKPIYDNENEGIIIELAFATSTGSVKHEKMRNHQDCLRREVYHVNGKKALKTEIEPYKLGVSWPIADAHGSDAAPELYLEGRVNMTGSTSPGLYVATIRKCQDSADYERVRSKLNEYVSDE